jgi:hypothetical protein
MTLLSSVPITPVRDQRRTGESGEALRRPQDVEWYRAFGPALALARHAAGAAEKED